ncbi:EexN family lipoprotein [Ursidibacter sp. B-7004-1]
MKKWLFCLTVFGLTACSEKDKEYYLSHIEKAQKKVQQCRQKQEKHSLLTIKCRRSLPI